MPKAIATVVPLAGHAQLRAPAALTGTGLDADVTGLYDGASGSVQYIVADPITRRCAVIDPVLNYDQRSGSTQTTSADQLLKHIKAHGLILDWILDTHPHADHFSAAGYLRDMTGAPTAIGERVIDVQKLWKTLHNLPDAVPMNGSQWDRLFADGERFTVGEMEAFVLLSPGHTLCSITYVIGNAAFVHDTLFMPDSGTARADFPGGNARQLWRSIQRILQLPSETRLFTGHDYRPNPNADALHPDAIYRLNIDTDGDYLTDMAFSYVFSKPQNGRQTVNVFLAKGSEARSPEAVGTKIVTDAEVSFSPKPNI